MASPLRRYKIRIPDGASNLYYLTSHLRIVSAFIIREIATRYGRSPGGYIWALLEPLAFIAMMSMLMSAFGRLPSMGDSFPLFYATGFLAFNMYKSMEAYLASSISANKPLMSYPNVAPIDSVIARFILQGATSIVVTCVTRRGSAGVFRVRDGQPDMRMHARSPVHTSSSMP